jgi:molybdopterin/thiamine biosynthesis adenylyltransferase
MRPRLKAVAWERRGDGQLRLVRDVRDQVIVDDPDGKVSRLLELLRDGRRTPAELADELGVPVADVSDAVELLDEYGLLEDADCLGRLDPAQQERHFSNLAFLESFATLAASQEDLLDRLRLAHVLVLGTGGLNSNTLPHLCGLGVGRLTLVDHDSVDARNFARQYLYAWDDLGRPKVERAAAWVRRFDPTIDVYPVSAEINGEPAVRELIGRTAPDIVMSGVDSPAEIDRWVNAACVSQGVPYVRAGMWVTQGIVWSVAPGRSACWQCAVPGEQAWLAAEAPEERDSVRLHRSLPRRNRGIGPIAGLLGALAAFEVLRYLTRFEPPAYAGRPLSIDFAAECSMRPGVWARDPACAVCSSDATAAARPPAPQLIGEGR